MLNKILNASTLPPAANQNSSINRTRRYTREQKNSIGNTTTANQLVDKKIKNIENLNNELHIGITTGLEIKKIEELLKQGSDPNGFIPHLKTYPMKDAIEHGKLEIVKLLLDYNADIHGNSEVLNSINPYTNLSYATYKNNYDIVEFLLEKNADPNYEIKKHCSQSLLCEAVCNNNIEIVKLLIDHGAKIDGLEYFRSPLYFSIKHNQDTKVMQLLLEHSVNPNYGSVYKKLWKDAILCDNISALPLLLKYDTKKQFIKENISTIILDIIALSSIDSMKVLLDQGYNINDIYFSPNCTIMMLAINTPIYLKKEVEFIMLLLANNAKPNAKYENGKTLIENTIENNRIDIAFQLRRYGAIADTTIISTIIDKYGIDPSTTPRSLQGLAVSTIKKHFEGNINDLPIPISLKKYIEENEVFV